MSMLLRVTSVLLLAAASTACSGDGSSPNDDAGTEADGGESGGDANGDSSGGNTEGGNASSGNNNGVDAGPDPDPDSGIVAFRCPNSVTTLTPAGGDVTSDDTFLTLRLSAGAVAQNTDIKVCAVPQAKWPAQAAQDGAGPVSAVYQIEPLGLTFAADVSASLTIQGASLASITSADGIAPLTLHRIPNTGTPRLNGVAMRLVAAPVLTGELDGSGHLYARHVDAAGARYAVQVGTSTTPLTKLTGETFDLSTKVSVLGSPTVATRALSLVTRGCNLEPLQPLGVEQAHSQEGGCEVEPVLREGTDLTVAGSSLPAGAVIDLTTAGSDVDATHPPPRFFCTHPGAANASVFLHFGVAGDREVTVIAQQDVTCTPSGDRLGAIEKRRANRIQHGPVVTTVAPLGTPDHASNVRVTTAATLAAFAPLGSDGWFTSGPISLPSENLFNSFHFTSKTNSSGAINGLTVNFDAANIAEPNSYVEGAYDAPTNRRFFEDAGGKLSAEGPNSASLSVDVRSFDQIDLQFGAPAREGTELSFADGTIDALLVSGLDSNRKVRFERWIRPRDLTLTSGRRSTPLLTNAQVTQLATASVAIATYEIALLNLAWDEARAFWPAGRVLPLAGGHLVRLQASRIDPTLVPVSPCPTAITSIQNGCQAGPYETLLVATDDGIEMFDPVTGKHLGNAFDATGAGTAKFRHVVTGPDGCLYASQQSSEPGVYRYRPTAAGVTAIDVAMPYFGVANAPGLGTTLAPLGLDFLVGDLLVANSSGALLTFDGTDFAKYVNSDTLRPHSALVVPGDVVLLTSHEAAVGAQTAVVVPPPSSGSGPQTFLQSLSSPEQVCLDAADSPNLLLAEGASRTITVYDRSTRDEIADFVYAGTVSPQGVWPLLNDGQWLVTGTNGLGVDTVLPGTEVELAKDTTFAGDSYYVSRACLPFDPAL